MQIIKMKDHSTMKNFGKIFWNIFEIGYTYSHHMIFGGIIVSVIKNYI